MVECCSNGTFRANMGNPVAPCPCMDDLILEPGKHGIHGAVVGGKDLLLGVFVSESPQDRNGFRHAEGEVKSGHSMALLFFAVPVGNGCLAVRSAQDGLSVGMLGE